QAIRLMYVGAELNALAAVVTIIDRLTTDQIGAEVLARYPDYTSAQVNAEANAQTIYLVAVLALGLLTWLGTAWALKRSMRGTRITATVLLLIGSTAILAPFTWYTPTLSAATAALPCLTGLVAVAFLWSARPRDHLTRRA